MAKGCCERRPIEQVYSGLVGAGDRAFDAVASDGGMSCSSGRKMFNQQSEILEVVVAIAVTSSDFHVGGISSVEVLFGVVIRGH